MSETTINVLNALQGQQAQLKRLIAQKMWISDAPKATLTEMNAQVTQIKALLEVSTIASRPQSDNANSGPF